MRDAPSFCSLLYKPVHFFKLRSFEDFFDLCVSSV